MRFCNQLIVNITAKKFCCQKHRVDIFIWVDSIKDKPVHCRPFFPISKTHNSFFQNENILALLDQIFASMKVFTFESTSQPFQCILLKFIEKQAAREHFLINEVEETFF